MKLGLYMLGLLATSGAVMIVGCGSDTTPGDPSGSSSASSSSGASSSSTTSSSSSSSGETSSSSSSSSSGSGGYADCADCSSNTMGAWVNECKTQVDACVADTACKALADCAYACPLTKDGGCCVRDCVTMLNTPAASKTLFEAADGCVYCQTCKTLCDPEATNYCAVNAPGSMVTCP